ncbi:UNKNOWN [Stylonychia lemnae]|uniref:Transmembrane protein n=1 Tax=Stylonychia lemnae TaxID=5949 RepID=A0A078B6X6_STYLE|nr:UNKNOWN [Stylonychia lemnae]|eukprot:CDW89052.1 UNKNOWN [Stylonychia lemnae]
MTDYLLDPNIRYQFGWAALAMIFSVSFVNIFCIIIENMPKLKQIIDKLWVLCKRKKRKTLKIKIMQNSGKQTTDFFNKQNEETISDEIQTSKQKLQSQDNSQKQLSLKLKLQYGQNSETQLQPIEELFADDITESNFGFSDIENSQNDNNEAYDYMDFKVNVIQNVQIETENTLEPKKLILFCNDINA